MENQKPPPLSRPPKLKNARKRNKTQLTDMLTRRVWMNSKTSFVTTSMTTAQEVYAKFCMETTLHGLKHTISANLHWSERWLWFILTGCAFFGAVYCGLAQLSRYTKEPVVVSMQRDFRSWSTTFPAVTACLVDRVDVEKAREAIKEYWNVTEESDLEQYQYYYSLIELTADVSFRTNLQNFWKYQSDETLRGVDLLKLALNVHPTFSLKVMVAKVDKEVLWVPVMTEMGICMSFNSQYAEFQFVMQDIDWTEEELLKCHYHSGQCFVRVDSAVAVKYFIHSPFDVPSTISNPTGEVNPGEELVIDFKAVEIQASDGVKKLTLEQRRCKYADERLSDNIRAFSFGLCQMHCRSRMANMFCGCRPYFYIKGASLGGTTALFVGASVLTVVETFIFLLRLIFNPGNYENFGGVKKINFIQ